MTLAALERTQINTDECAKKFGAYYTSQPVSDFLVRWAIRSGRDTVIDPSFGGGAFLVSAARRISSLGGTPFDQVFGVELDRAVHAETSTHLGKNFGICERNLWQKDFFDLEPLPAIRTDAVIGNPPFIRFHRFSAEARDRALAQAAEQGVKLTRLSSSWAPVVVHGVSMLKSGGRLAMVLPAELGHAKYALPVLDHLAKSFGKVSILTFRDKLFPDLNEVTLLVLAERKGGRSNSILHRDVTGDAELANISLEDGFSIARTRKVSVDKLVNRSQRLVEYLLPKKTRELYDELQRSKRTVKLGDVVDVGIGYVTGANDFFHLSPAAAREHKIPDQFLRPAVRRGRALAGLRFKHEDWASAVGAGNAGYLLFIDGSADLPREVLSYLEVGEERGVPGAYKCRMREPWYSVPHVARPDGFLTYMSGIVPRLVTNETGAVAPNTLHVLRTKGTPISSVAALWLTSLVKLSAEIEGHALGGGMLKLEPGEADNCLIPSPAHLNGELQLLHRDLDELIRCGREVEARQLADERILRWTIGLSSTECRLLREGAELLTDRRSRKSSK